ncbi:MAG: CBS domain-containing protein, partial [Opitutales bacterium]
EKTTADKALRSFLRKHQQFAVVVDEFGSTAGVLTMEDIIESILGREIFEKDDVAVDMRELAMRTRTAKESKEAKARTGAHPEEKPKTEGS